MLITDRFVKIGAGGLTWRASTSTGLAKRYGDFNAVRRRLARRRRRRIPGAARPLRLRQDHDLAHGRGLHRADRAARCTLGGADVTYAAAVEAQHRHGVPELCAVPAHDAWRENVAFGLEMRKLPKRRDRAPRRRRRCALVRLDGSAAACRASSRAASSSAWRWPARWPSGPTCCCSTSRSSNLDAKLRQEVRVEIRELQRQLGLTTVMVTHDQEEALTMADRLVVMNEGAVRQVGTPARPLRAAGRPLRGGLRRPQHLPRRHASRRPGASAPTAGCASRAATARTGQRRRWRCGPNGSKSAPAPLADWTTACPARWNSSPISAR